MCGIGTLIIFSQINSFGLDDNYNILSNFEKLILMHYTLPCHAYV